MRVSISRIWLGAVLGFGLVAAAPFTPAPIAMAEAGPAVVQVAASAQPKTQPAPSRPAPGHRHPRTDLHHRGRHAGHAVFGAAAQYLGLTPAELAKQLKSGQSLAQIATQRGKPVQGLKDAMLDQVKNRLQQSVLEGELTKAEADEILGRVQQHIDGAINRTWPVHPSSQAS
jgi:hypothetical protein